MIDWEAACHIDIVSVRSIPSLFGSPSLLFCSLLWSSQLITKVIIIPHLSHPISTSVKLEKRLGIPIPKSTGMIHFSAAERTEILIHALKYSLTSYSHTLLYTAFLQSDLLKTWAFSKLRIHPLIQTKSAWFTIQQTLLDKLALFQQISPNFQPQY